MAFSHLLFSATIVSPLLSLAVTLPYVVAKRSKLKLLNCDGHIDVYDKCIIHFCKIGEVTIMKQIIASLSTFYRLVVYYNCKRNKLFVREMCDHV